MKTSTTQFEVMVEFMERNGDLNKPAEGSFGRLGNIKKWNDLCSVLNMDTWGTSKQVDKWKKVWSDLKNNTKKKAAKINRAACGTGGGPASKLVLTDLEQRVLNLMGPQSATGLPGIQEVGFEVVEPVPPILRPPSRSPTPSYVEIHVEEAPEELNKPGDSGLSTPFPAVILPSAVVSPTAHHAQSPSGSRRGTRDRYSSPSPATAGPRRRILRRPATRTAPPAVDVATEQFVNSDTHWRNLATQLVTLSLRMRGCGTGNSSSRISGKFCLPDV